MVLLCIAAAVVIIKNDITTYEPLYHGPAPGRGALQNSSGCHDCHCRTSGHRIGRSLEYGVSFDMKTKRQYDFTLRFKLSGQDGEADQVVERLGEGGCRDALVGTGVPGQIAMVFTRCAGTELEAIQGAIDDILKALPSAALLPNAGVMVCSSPSKPYREMS